MKIAVNKYIVPFGHLGKICYKDGNMERVNGTPLYWLGYHIGQLSAQLSGPIEVASVSAPWVTSIETLEYFVKGIEGLPLSRAVATDVLMKMNATSPTHLSQTNAVDLNFALFNFQTVLLNELPQINIFFVSQKRAYDMSALIGHGETLLSKEALEYLGASKNDVIADIREAGKCLAFEISTAVGFHIYRAIESVIIKDYFPALGVKESEWEKNRGLGPYIQILEVKKRDSKITTLLRHLKDNYRNPINHPQEFWGFNDAENAIPLAVSAINMMVQDIQTLIRPTGPINP